MEENKELREYFLENNIQIKNEYFKGKDKGVESLKAHVRFIAEFQRSLLKFNERYKINIQSIIGKEIEQLKNAYIILDYNNREQEFNSTLKVLKDALNKLKEVDYKKLIRRAVGRKEITIGRIDERNLRVLDEFEIGKIKKCYNNLFEEDLIRYLRKEKEYFSKETIREAIKYYVEILEFSLESLKYIDILVFIPNEVVRYLNKNRDNINRDKLIKLINEK